MNNLSNKSGEYQMGDREYTVERLTSPGVAKNENNTGTSNGH